MDAREYNKKKCREYYYRTKDNLTEEQKERRRETSRLAQKRFYEKNKELCKFRTAEIRLRKKEEKLIIKKNELSEKRIKFYNLITQKEIQFINSLNLHSLIKKSPRLTMWDKKINEWTFKDFNKLQSLLT